MTVVEAADRILPLEEPEASELIAEVLSSEGITVIAGTGAAGVSFHEGDIHP